MHPLKPRDEHISDRAFDGYFAGEITSAELGPHLAQCEQCQLRYDALRAERDAFLARMPTWQALAGSRAIAKRKSTRPHWIWMSTCAVAAAVLLALRPQNLTQTTRTKGGPSINVFVKHGELVTRAQDGDTVRPGDLLRLTYSTLTSVEFALLQRDAQHARIYYPLGPRTAAMQKGHEVALDFSVRLDDTPGSESLYGLFCSESVELEPLRAALERTGQLEPPPLCHVDRLTLKKARNGE